MPSWYYSRLELKNTPSIQNGLPFETERRYRREGARFIIECGAFMGLRHNTVATGVVYFHRFYMFRTFSDFPRYVTACCCLFLAGKVEETPKKCKDIIKVASTKLDEKTFESFGKDPREEVMILERILLQTIKFDLQVDHPYQFLVKYAKCLTGDRERLNRMVQMAWNFINDSLSTTVSLQWEPEIIAVALIHLASKLGKFKVEDWIGRKSHHLRWWDMFVADVTMEILEDICHQVLDLYSAQNAKVPAGVSPPQSTPSKSSPPAKRAKYSPTHKSSPVTSTHSAPKSHLDEKIDQTKIPMADGTMYSSYSQGYNTGYGHSFGGAPLLPPNSSGPPYPGSGYGPPSVQHYSGAAPPGHQGNYYPPPRQNYYPPQ